MTLPEFTRIDSRILTASKLLQEDTAPDAGSDGDPDPLAQHNDLEISQGGATYKYYVKISEFFVKAVMSKEYEYRAPGALQRRISRDFLATALYLEGKGWMEGLPRGELGIVVDQGKARQGSRRTVKEMDTSSVPGNYQISSSRQLQSELQTKMTYGDYDELYIQPKKNGMLFSALLAPKTQPLLPYLQGQRQVDHSSTIDVSNTLTPDRATVLSEMRLGTLAPTTAPRAIPLSDIFLDFLLSLNFQEAHAEGPPTNDDIRAKSDDAGEEEDKSEGDKEGEKDEEGDNEGDDSREDDDSGDNKDEEEEEEPGYYTEGRYVKHECAKSSQCAPLKHHYDACAERVQQQQQEDANYKRIKEDCVEEYRLHCCIPTGNNKD
ncbi:MAG: hypothetical protein Q9166_005142 [cf. Caloplaca sp. 2 TL-2023]